MNLDLQIILKFHFDYHESGNLVWKNTGKFIKTHICSTRRSNGSIRKGYISTTFLGREYLLHRLIWLYHYGYPIPREIDHKDGDTLFNNKIENLRPCTTSQNMANQKELKSNNKSGYKGVYWRTRDRKWAAQIGKNKKIFDLGYYSSPEEAARAYDKEAIKLYGEFASLNFPQT